ncbi:CYTH domain-containing protein [Aliikangiella sp. IMCC44359]|uniref:CYTH domain-containing protein n=1 Tax=Aliikangiella sp. IMCC44359 TaxID=3459125 RepID=UPI00403AC05D
MAKEIERKFLVDLNKIGALEGGVTIKQGYISTSDKSVVRLRLIGQKAYLTLKGENQGISRSEFEYEIPVEDAHKIISELCSEGVVEKTRYLIQHANHTWEVDIFHGDNDGLIVAEIELRSEDEYFEKPSWVTAEVSDDAKYYNSSLLDNPFSNWK